MAGGQDWVFWATAGGMGLLVAAILVTAVWRGRASLAPAAAYDLRVYRDQLTEIDRDLARGVIGADDATRLRTEVSRRILEADRALAAAAATGQTLGRGSLAISALVVMLVAGSFWSYWRLGAPGYDDVPFSRRVAEAEQLRTNRPSQAEAEAKAASTNQPAAAPDPQYADLVQKLRQTVAERPDDTAGLEILVNTEAGLGNFVAAAAAQTKLIAAKAATVTGEDHAGLAELMIMSANGYVSPQAEAELTKALTLDPENGLARYYLGLTYAQIGRPDTGFALWRALLEGSNVGDPWVEPLLAQIGDLAAMAGVDYQVPTPVQPGTALPGPTAGDMAAAAEMSDADRAKMVETMVGQLSDRLNSEGGSPEEWARLIGAYGVLAKPEEAKAAWVKAQAAFAQSPADLDVVRVAAVKAGVAE